MAYYYNPSIRRKISRFNRILHSGNDGRTERPIRPIRPSFRPTYI